MQVLDFFDNKNTSKHPEVHDLHHTNMTILWTTFVIRVALVGGAAKPQVVMVDRSCRKQREKHIRFYGKSAKESYGTMKYNTFYLHKVSQGSGSKL